MRTILRVVDDSELTPALTRAAIAIRGVKTSTFKPAQCEGRLVEAQFNADVFFSLK